MANDFSGDSNCVALYNFESGALTTDSKGTNTLTAYNTPVASSTHKEGSYSADFEHGDNDSYYILDSNLSSNFPLKNGGSYKDFSVCLWAQFESIYDQNGMVNKYDTVNGYRSFSIRCYTGGIRVFIGYNSGASFETLYEGGSITTGRWYHLGFTYEYTTRAWKLVVWDDTASSKLIDTSGTSTNTISVAPSSFGLGCGWFNSTTQPNADSTSDGLIDELVVFNDILSAGEIDQIRAGTYGAGGSTSKPWYYYRQQ